MICYINSVLSSRLILIDKYTSASLFGILREYNVHYELRLDVTDYMSIDLQPQKIVLDEFQMNILFKEVIYQYIPLVEICWTNMSHEDFCINLQKEDIYE